MQTCLLYLIFCLHIGCFCFSFKCILITWICVWSFLWTPVVFYAGHSCLAPLLLVSSLESLLIYFIRVIIWLGVPSLNLSGTSLFYLHWYPLKSFCDMVYDFLPLNTPRTGLGSWEFWGVSGCLVFSSFYFFVLGFVAPLAQCLLLWESATVFFMTQIIKQIRH